VKQDFCNAFGAAAQSAADAGLAEGKRAKTRVETVQFSASSHLLLAAAAAVAPTHLAHTMATALPKEISKLGAEVKLFGKWETQECVPRPRPPASRRG
jgi:hypothetical protein